MNITGYSRLPVIFERARQYAREQGATEEHLVRFTYRSFGQSALNGQLPGTLRFNNQWYALETAVPEIAVAVGMVSAPADLHHAIDKAA